MKPDEILSLRLKNQALARASFTKPEDAVAWFGAMQAQDYLGALWAIGLRTRGATESSVEAAESRRAIVRTWPLRGTLHFVAAADARWLTQLLAPRVIARNEARWKREIGIDAKLVARADEVITRALEGGRRLPREELYEALEARRIGTGDSRGLHILLWLALRGRLCFAGRQGKQQTFALLDEWLPPAAPLARDEALARLAQRYFTSRGPATCHDFMWWAGITAKDARAAIDGAGNTLRQDALEGGVYWQAAVRGKASAAKAPHVQLLPAYDEYTVAYEDRSLLVIGAAPALKMSLLSPAVLVNGRVVGTWKRVLDQRSAIIKTQLSRKLTGAESAALADAALRFGEYLGCDARLTR